MAGEEEGSLVNQPQALTSRRGGTTKQPREMSEYSTLQFIFMSMTKGGYVYILCSPDRTTLYVGVTSDLTKRVYEHRIKHYPESFSAKCNCVILVYYAGFASIYDAIAEEKRIKGGSRRKRSC
jgi:putative endonuclease